MKALGWLLWLFPLYLLSTGQLVAWLEYATQSSQGSASSSSTSPPSGSGYPYSGIFSPGAGILGSSAP